MALAVLIDCVSFGLEIGSAGTEFDGQDVQEVNCSSLRAILMHG